MEIKGKILEISETQEIKDNFRKREFILEYNENDKFTEFLKFETTQDKTEILDNFSPGQEVEVFFNLRGRAWVDKTGKKSYFNSLQAWRLKPAEDGGAGSEGSFSTPTRFTQAADSGKAESEKKFEAADEDDLPF